MASKAQSNVARLAQAIRNQTAWAETQPERKSSRGRKLDPHQVAYFAGYEGNSKERFWQVVCTELDLPMTWDSYTTLVREAAAAGLVTNIKDGSWFSDRDGELKSKYGQFITLPQYAQASGASKNGAPKITKAARF